VVWLSVANSQRGLYVNLPAEHSRYPCRTQPLRKRQEVVVQIPATARKWEIVARGLWNTELPSHRSEA
jgi:hypothetical protein